MESPLNIDQQLIIADLFQNGIKEGQSGFYYITISEVADMLGITAAGEKAMELFEKSHPKEYASYMKQFNDYHNDQNSDSSIMGIIENIENLTNNFNN